MSFSAARGSLVQGNADGDGFVYYPLWAYGNTDVFIQGVWGPDPGADFDLTEMGPEFRDAMLAYVQTQGVGNAQVLTDGEEPVTADGVEGLRLLNHAEGRRGPIPVLVYSDLVVFRQEGRLWAFEVIGHSANVCAVHLGYFLEGLRWERPALVREDDGVI